MSITACIAVVRSSESVDAGALVRFVSISFCISMGCGSCNGREIAPGDVYTRLYIRRLQSHPSNTVRKIYTMRHKNNPLGKIRHPDNGAVDFDAISRVCMYT